MASQQDPVRVVTPDDRRPGPGTPGMDRQEAFATEGTWSGFVRTEAGMVSGWHHHGDWESVIYVLTGALRMEFGPDGASTVEAAPVTSSTFPRAPSTGRATLRPNPPTSSSCEPAPEVSRPSTSTGRSGAE